MESPDNPCPGCDGNTRQSQEDHCHQFINWMGNVSQVWVISGRVFGQRYDARHQVQQEYGATTIEAQQYLNKIPKLYN